MIALCAGPKKLETALLTNMMKKERTMESMAIEKSNPRERKAQIKSAQEAIFLRSKRSATAPMNKKMTSMGREYINSVMVAKIGCEENLVRIYNVNAIRPILLPIEEVTFARKRYV